MTLLAQGAQGDAPAVEGRSILMWLPGLATNTALVPLARSLVGLENDGFGWVWLVGMCLIVHLSLLWDENVGRNKNSQPDDPTGCWTIKFGTGSDPAHFGLCDCQYVLLNWIGYLGILNSERPSQ